MSILDDMRSLTRRLSGLRSYMLICKSAVAFLLVATAVLITLVLANVLHAAFYLDVTTRVIFLALIACVLSYLIGRYLVYPIVLRPSLESISRQVERKYPHLKNQLIASLQLERNLIDNRENYSTAMISALIAQTSKMVEGLDLKASYSNRPLIRSARYFGVAFAATLLIAVLAPGLFQSSLYVFSHPLEEIEIERTYTIDVKPGDVELLKYDNLDVEVVVRGEKLPDEAELFWDNSGEGGDWKSVRLEGETSTGVSSNLGEALGLTSDSTTFTYKFKEVRHDFVYYVSAGREQSAEYAVKVVDKPRVTGIKLTYSYPKYTRLKQLVIDENDGNIQAIRGTNVNVELSTNKPVETGGLIFSDGDTISMRCNDTISTASIAVGKTRSYHIEVTDRSGYSNPDPIEYRITALDDAYPEIFMVSPGGNVDLGEDMSVELVANLIDDFGFSKLMLNYTVHLTATEQWDISEEVSIDKGTADQQVNYFWDLANSGLLPGSWVEYHLEVFDNDYVTGPKSTKGPVMLVRLPTLGEIFTQIESSREDQIEEYMEALQQQNEIRDEIQQLSDAMRMEEEIDWENKQALESVVDKQESLVNDLDEMARQFDQANQQAKDNQLMTLEMVQKIQELQKLIEEVATPEMKEALKKLHEALSELSKEDVEKAMQNFEMTTEDVIQNIERAIAQLKQLQAEQMMENMIRMAEEILKNQQGVNSLTEESEREKLPGYAQKEEQVRESLEDLKKKADELEKLFKEAGMDQIPDSKNFCSATRQSGAEQPMEQMMSGMKDSDKVEAMMSGSSAEEKVQKMLDQMQESRASLSQQMGEMAEQQLREALDNVFYLSEKQEDVIKEAGRFADETSELRGLADKQQVLRSHTEWLRDELLEMAKQSIFVQNQIDNFFGQCMEYMGNSMSSLTEMRASQSVKSQEEAVHSLNEASKVIMQSLNSQKQCNSSCNKPNQNMFKKMSSMCQNQKNINKRTQNMCNNPNRMGNQGKRMLERLAAEQQSVRKSIQQLQDEVGDRKQISRRLENMAEEMKKVVEALERGGVGDETLNRQKKIYQRMLDFQLAMERQDYSEVRQAETTEQILRRGPGQIDETSMAGSESYDKKLKRFLDEGYPPEYEQIIKDYFRAVMEAER